MGIWGEWRVLICALAWLALHSEAKNITHTGPVSQPEIWRYPPCAVLSKDLVTAKHGGCSRERPWRRWLASFAFTRASDTLCIKSLSSQLSQSTQAVGLEPRQTVDVSPNLRSPRRPKQRLDAITRRPQSAIRQHWGESHSPGRVCAG